MTKLISNLVIVICFADKGGGIVVQNYSDYHQETINILFDAYYYEKISHGPFQDTYSSLQQLLTEAKANNIITKREYHYIPMPKQTILLSSSESQKKSD